MDYNNLFTYRDGHLFWIESPSSNIPAGSIAGSLRNDGYIGIFINGVYYFEHRIIWEMFNGPIPDGMSIDHMDRVRSNNHPDNLRLATHQQNHFNRTKQSNNKSGYKGVSWHKQKQKWVAQIKIDGRNKFLGFFHDPEKAYEAYCEKALEYYGEFANLN